MTLNEILIAILWVIVGCWISYKRNWYADFANDEEWPQGVVIGIVIMSAPLCLIIAFFKEMVFDSWNNN
jgi:TRAP-type C4-dicarboxylate transport system permease small subunit